MWVISYGSFSIIFFISELSFVLPRVNLSSKDDPKENLPILVASKLDKTLRAILSHILLLLGFFSTVSHTGPLNHM